MRVSIVIPTRERAFYLPHCLRTVLEIDDDDIEVIVSDNASTDETQEVLAAFDDPRLKRLRTEARVSMRQNFEFALGHCTGDYVIYIGDDDAFIPGQFAVFREVIETQRPDTLSWSIPTYGWIGDAYTGKAGGMRFERRYLYGSLDAADPAVLRHKLMHADFDDFIAPTIYHGAASRAFIERRRRGDGVFFAGTSPELYFTYLAILSGARHMHLSHPITISGKSAASTGAAHNSKEIKEGAENPAVKFAAENRADPMRDVTDMGLSVRGAFFQVLETVRRNLGEAERPDYAAWFRFVLADRKSHGAAEHADLVRRLRGYAAEIGEADTLERVLGESFKGVTRRRLASRWQKLRSKLASFRVKTEIDGENTVHTAARVADMILGAGFSARPGARPEQAARWRGAVARSKPFPRQL